MRQKIGGGCKRGENIGGKSRVENEGKRGVARIRKRSSKRKEREDRDREMEREGYRGKEMMNK